MSEIKILDLETTVALAFILVTNFNIEIAKTKTSFLKVLHKFWYNSLFFDSYSTRPDQDHVMFSPNNLCSYFFSFFDLSCQVWLY